MELAQWVALRSKGPHYHIWVSGNQVMIGSVMDGTGGQE